MYQCPDCVILWQVLRTVERVARLPASFGHESSPEIDAGDFHISCNIARGIRVLLCNHVGAIQLRVSLALDTVVQTSLFDWRGSHQQQPRLMGLNGWVSEEFDQVLFVLVQRHMLSVLGLQEAGVVGSKQNGLCFSVT